MMGFGKLYGSGKPKMVSFWVSIMLHFRGGGCKQKVVELVFLRREFLRDPIHGGVPKHQPSRDGE